MKRLFLIVPIIILVCSCQITPAIKIYDFSSSIQSEKEGNGIEIKVLDIEWQTPLMEPAGIRDILLEIKNKGNSIARINWEKSSMNYNNTSYGIFLEGMKYADAGKAPPTTVIPKDGMISRRVYSSSQPRYYGGGWGIFPMAPSIQLLLCVEIDGKENYFTITTSYTEQKTK